MAAMMTCNPHGPFDGDRCPVSGCTGFWRPYAVPRPEPSDLCEAPGCEMPRPCHLHPQADEQARFRAHQAARAEPASSRVAAAQLRFPWGVVAVPPSGLLNIGRDFGAECGSEIADFDNVSRRHAQVRVSDGAVLVVDQLSTNGTTVNGEPTTAYVARVISDGDTVGFGAHLRAVVEVMEQADDHD